MRCWSRSFRGVNLGRIVVESKLVTETQISEALARQLQISFIELKNFNFKPEVVRKLPEALARRFRALVLEDRGDSYLVGMADPTDLFAYDDIACIAKTDSTRGCFRGSAIADY